MVGATKSQNAADRERFAVMQTIGCVPCMIDHWSGVPATVQHITEGGRRLDDQHQMTYRSCRWHHLGQIPKSFGGSVYHCAKKYGPSFARDKRAFADRYGTERELVQIQDALNRMSLAAYRQGDYMTDERLMRLTLRLHREIVLGGEAFTI